MESHFGYKSLYLFQLLLIINLECVLGLQYPFPISTGRWWLRLLSRAPAEGNTQSKREWEDPGDTAASRVFFPSLMVRCAAVQGGGHLLEGED